MRRLRDTAALAAVLWVGAASADSPPPQEVPRLDGMLGSFSLGADRGPVTIRARAMEFDYRGRVLTYRGDVTVSQGELTLSSELLRVSLDTEGADRPREIVAEGDVRIAQGDRRATGGRAVFDNVARTVTLSEGARLSDGPNEVEGERVIVYLDEERSVVEGGRDRVRAVLHPPSSVADPEERP